tara:strand:+ start:503 stop:664 length:162 start_codon:yes stop_codon:yes gene_type:complete
MIAVLYVMKNFVIKKKLLYLNVVKIKYVMIVLITGSINFIKEVVFIVTKKILN